MTLGNCLLKVNLSGLPNDMRFVAKTPEERLDRMPEALSSRVSHQKELVGALAKWAADALQDVDLRAIGHRVVHGGRDFDGPVLANKKILGFDSRINIIRIVSFANKRHMAPCTNLPL